MLRLFLHQFCICGTAALHPHNRSENPQALAGLIHSIRASQKRSHGYLRLYFLSEYGLYL